MPHEPLRDPASWMRRAVGTVRGGLIAGFGFLTLVLFNVLQVASLALMPLSKAAFRRFNRWCANTWWGWCVSGAERLNGTEIVVTGEAVPPRENALVVANHQQMPDIPVIMKLAKTKERLGDLKFFVKKQLKWVPGMGWGMQFIDCLFVDRDWSSDREHIERTFARLVDNGVPVWLVSFVEGTRSTKDKLASSRDYARTRGLEETHHVQVPRTKGFAASVQGLSRHAAAVYDLTIGYEKGVPTLWQYIKGFVERVHLHVRRFPIENLPDDEEGLRAWLLARFVEKDRLLGHFYRCGEFPSA